MLRWRGHGGPKRAAHMHWPLIPAAAVGQRGGQIEVPRRGDHVAKGPNRKSAKALYRLSKTTVHPCVHPGCLTGGPIWQARRALELGISPTWIRPSKLATVQTPALRNLDGSNCRRVKVAPSTLGVVNYTAAVWSEPTCAPPLKIHREITNVGLVGLCGAAESGCGTAGRTSFRSLRGATHGFPVPQDYQCYPRC